VRIVAGEWRGRRIEAPPGKLVRPSSDRLREALFSVLAARLGTLEGLEVADLFAGTGAIGLEALSRGAAHATFVDSDPGAVRVIERNVAALGAGSRATVVRRPAELLGRASRPCDLLFLDPPYGQDLARPALTRLIDGGWVAEGAWLTIETERTAAVAHPELSLELVRDYGKARLHLMRRAAG
jgi:16S rRNA (guanine966-N2)-methyltransferase